MSRLSAILLFAACATPAKVECACSCPAPTLDTGLVGTIQLPPTLNGLPLECFDGGICIVPTGAL